MTAKSNNKAGCFGIDKGRYPLSFKTNLNSPNLPSLSNSRNGFFFFCPRTPLITVVEKMTNIRSFNMLLKLTEYWVWVCSWGTYVVRQIRAWLTQSHAWWFSLFCHPFCPFLIVSIAHYQFVIAVDLPFYKFWCCLCSMLISLLLFSCSLMIERLRS